jgi:hypothetical protein
MPAALRDVQTGKRHPLDPARTFVLGRTREADVRITNGLVGRRHALIDPIPSASGVTYWLRDGGSTNGTELNGARVGGDGVILRPGDVVGLPELLFVFESDFTAPVAPPPPGSPLPPPRPPVALAPADVARDAAAAILADLDAASGYRQAALGPASRAAARAAAARLPGPRAAAALGALDALERLDAGDLMGAFAALLAHLDRGAPPSPLYTRLARVLVAFSSWYAAPLLARRAAEAIDAGVDAAPYAALLAATFHAPSIHLVRERAQHLRDRGHPSAAPLLAALTLATPPPWLPALHAELFPPTREEVADRRFRDLAALALATPRRGPVDPTRVAEAIELLRATPAGEIVKRAALRRLLEDLTGELRGADPEGWLGGGSL